MAEYDVINSSWAAPEQRCSRQHGRGADYTLRILSRCEEKSGGKYMSSVEKGNARPDIVTRRVGLCHSPFGFVKKSRRENVAIAVSICTPRLFLLTRLC